MCVNCPAASILSWLFSSVSCRQTVQLHLTYESGNMLIVSGRNFSLRFTSIGFPCDPPLCLALCLSLWLKFSSKSATHCAQKLIDIKANKQMLNCRRGLRVVTGIEGIWLIAESQRQPEKSHSWTVPNYGWSALNLFQIYDTCIAALALAIDLVCIFR